MTRSVVLALFLGAALTLPAFACRAKNPAGNSGNPPDFPQISLARVAEGFTRPVHITHAGDASNRLFVVEQGGLIRIVKDGGVLPEPFLNISALLISGEGEQGLLSVAFPPGFSASKQHFYVYYTAKQGIGDTVLARFRATAVADVADPASGQTLLTIVQPFANHNGGQLAFGNDGFLYIAVGDGGSGNDPQGNGQNPDTLLGKLLRIDVESLPESYAVPPDNPFVGRAGFRPEIWALGLRNPWRFSFDRETFDIYIADVGQGSFEEVDFQAASSTGGENYGWNIMEGLHCLTDPACSREGLVLPVAEYSHDAGNCSVTGGLVYRGAEFAALRGIYLYGDLCTGKIWGLRRVGDAWENKLLLDTDLTITTFGEDEAGNLYVADYALGVIYKINATTGP